jgi:hypothetical protein
MGRNHVTAGYRDMSNEELYRLIKERAPEVAAVTGEVQDSNRETTIAFLLVLSGADGSVQPGETTQKKHCGEEDR